MYDVIIIGAGPAGITSSLYTVRANLKTLIFDKETSSVKTTPKVENYYGFENGISGKELYENGVKQAENLGVEVKKEEVVNIKIEEDIFIVQTLYKEFKAKSVILATGNKKNKPNIENIEKFEGKGVSYCAICDGFFYRGKDVIVIGNGNYAESEAKELEPIVKSVKIVKEKVISIKGNDRVEEIELEDGTILKTDGIFIALGVAGSTDFAKKLGARVENNKIVVNEKMETTVKGLFACGDCTGGIYQISKAIYEGTVAGISQLRKRIS
ncbi:MAG: NAD(P)/FAD-dependent oxidoreductase [Clostridia bacterium]|nr:NAD(P)/FAD-dependent oxidoreductase [Clostridia bacterium]